MLSSRLYAKDTISQFYYIEIDLHNAIFAPKKFDKYRKIGLKQLAGIGTMRRTKHVFSRLLRDSATACHNVSTPPIQEISLKHIFKREATMLIELRIFRFDYRTNQVGRNLLEVYPFLMYV